MMAKVYYNRLFLGSILFDTIPSKYQAQVKQIGREQVQTGNLSKAEYEQMFKEPYDE